MENEAVVAAALGQMKGFELIESRHLLWEFWTWEGLTSWEVFDDEKHVQKKR